MKDVSIRTHEQLIAALRRARLLRKETQRELGESAGLPQTTISKIEVGLVGPSLKTLFKVLAALELEIVVRSKKAR
ncbi:MAG: helix-turn-helix transcriptional regulator [Bdellovibrionota bacterium]